MLRKYRLLIVAVLVVMSLVSSTIGASAKSLKPANLYGPATVQVTSQYPNTTPVSTIAMPSGHSPLQLKAFYPPPSPQTPTLIPPPVFSIPPIPTITGTGYHVTGNTIYDPLGKPVIFRGVARPSLEWRSTGQNLSLADYQLMQTWHVKIVRLPLNQRFWLNNTNNYQQTIDQNIQWIKSLGMNVLLDLHWSDKGNPAVSPAQQCMADAHSLPFWQQVAAKYKNDPSVFFELYN